MTPPIEKMIYSYQLLETFHDNGKCHKSRIVRYCLMETTKIWPYVQRKHKRASKKQTNKQTHLYQRQHSSPLYVLA